MIDSTTRLAEPNAWVNVYTDALSANASLLKRVLQDSPSRPELIAVVKADGYGHGAARAAMAFRAAGIGRFAVTTLDEAAALVSGGIDPSQTPVLVFAPVVTESQAALLCHLRLEATVCDANHARLLIRAAEDAGGSVRVHLKIDTGMSRLGEEPAAAIAIARLIAASDRLHLAGTYTHFARASEAALAPTNAQLSSLVSFCDSLRREGIHPGLRHAANSAAAIRLPDARLDAVRLGTILYGQYPSSHVPHIDGLETRTWAAKARVVFVHDLRPGASVGYGAEVSVRKPTRAAVIAVGYADGFGLAPASLFTGRRGLQSLVKQALGKDSPYVIIHGERAPVLGRIAMQMAVVDVSASPKPVKTGDIAEIPMRRLAASARLPRVYHTAANEAGSPLEAR